jgi:hypothetical protein
MNQHNFFAGRSIVIATKHKKQNAMAALLEKELGVTCIVPNDLDTDQLGTFSGEIERELSPMDAAKKKCTLAMELTNTDLAIASEGSFGAHPLLYFLPANDEILVLIDKKNGLEIAVREISTKTKKKICFSLPYKKKPNSLLTSKKKLLRIIYLVLI